MYIQYYLISVPTKEPRGPKSGARWPSNDAVKLSLISSSLEHCNRACNLQGCDYTGNVVPVDLINGIAFSCPFTETNQDPGLVLSCKLCS